MWNKIKQILLFPFIWPLYFVACLFEKFDLSFVNYIITSYNKIMGVHRELPERTWPYEDDIFEEDGQQKIVYAHSAEHLESKLSRKFRRSKKND